MPLGAAKRLVPHEQRRKRTGVASSKLGNLAFHLTLAFYVVNKWLSISVLRTDPGKRLIS